MMAEDRFRVDHTRWVKTWIWLIALLVFLGGAPSGLSSVTGAISGGPPPSFDTHTIEALTVDSALILTATVDREVLTTGAWEGRFLPDEVLKSPPTFAMPSVLDETVSFNPIDAGKFQFPRKGSRVLLFLRLYPGSPTKPYLNDCVILDTPGEVRSMYSASVVDLTLVPMTDKRQVLAAVRAELSRVPVTKSETSFFCYPLRPNILPDDDRLVPAAREWVKSDNPLARCLAIGIFQAHRDPQDTPALQALLKDPFVTDMPMYLSPWSGREYVVRWLAWRALDKRGATPAAIVSALPQAGLYREVSWWWPLFLLIGPLAVFGGARFYLRKRRRLPGLPMWRHVSSFLTFGCVLLAALVGLCWHHSGHTADDFVYARHGFLLDITSLQDNVMLEWGRPWPAETPFVHAVITPDPVEPNELKREMDFRNHFGISQWGSIWDVYCGRSFPWPWMFDIELSHEIDPLPFRLTGTVPPCKGIAVACAYPYLIGFLLAFPALRLLWASLAAIYRRWKLAQRAKEGLCPKCAYDLRAHAPGQCCPECGTPIVPGPGKGMIKDNMKASAIGSMGPADGEIT
jgi:hypothetical protein